MCVKGVARTFALEVEVFAIDATTNGVYMSAAISEVLGQLAEYHFFKFEMVLLRCFSATIR